MTLFVNSQIISAQIDNTITRSGIKMTLKSKTVVGKNATLAKYCNSKSGKCEELIITSDKKSISMPLTSGPVYNIIKTGKTQNYKGLTQTISKSRKLTQYYTIVNNQIIVITPAGKLSHFINIYNFGSRPLKVAEVNSIFLDTGYDNIKDECKCFQRWKDCFRDAEPPGTSDEKGLENIQECDKKYVDCKVICRNIIMENINTILVFRKTSAATDFQIKINTK